MSVAAKSTEIRTLLLIYIYLISLYKSDGLLQSCCDMSRDVYGNMLSQYDVWEII